jgi:hypothetical protein
MFHIPTHVGVTKYALERSGVLKGKPANTSDGLAVVVVKLDVVADRTLVPSPTLYDSMRPHFIERRNEANEDLAKMGLPPLGTPRF